MELGSDLLGRLLEIRDIAYMDSLKRFKTGRPGDLPCNKTVPLDCVMLNVTVDSEPVLLPASGWKLPKAGQVEFDFVDAKHPAADTPLLNELDIAQLLRPNRRRWIDWKLLTRKSEFADHEREQRRLQLRGEIDLTEIEDEEEWEPKAYAYLRSVLNDKAMTLEQATLTIQEFEDPSIAVRAAVTMFRRIIDWHGFEHTVFKKLTMSQRKGCGRRLGYHNLYDEITAVGYYELDLSNPQMRWVMGQITRLAILEPGENMVEETYNDINFELPNGWTSDTPSKGIYTTYYCREAKTIEKLRAQCEPHTIPPNFDEFQKPSGDWVTVAKRLRIRWKLAGACERHRAAAWQLQNSPTFRRKIRECRGCVRSA